MIIARDANESDVAAISEIFYASYGEHYVHPEYYQVDQLKKLVYSDDSVLLVAEDQESGKILGTASVVLQVGAYADLVGEFGRLAVHPDARGKGLGNLLMKERVSRVKNQLHLGLVENRVAHPYSQKISIAHGFVPIGFIPAKLRFKGRESIALYARYFGTALSLRRNNPRIVPESHRLASLALANCKLPCDGIVDEGSTAYPYVDDYEVESLSADGYTSLLRIERGRVQNRAIFGPLQLHCGLFQLRVSHSSYIIAKRDGQIVGALGFAVDDAENTARIFELISLDDQPIRFLLQRFLDQCRALGVELIHVDVSAYVPRMQRTLIELGFLPAAYIPAMVFQNVERLDAVMMVRLLVPYGGKPPQLCEAGKPIADEVIERLLRKEVEPRVSAAIPRAQLFRELSEEQAQRLASICGVERFAPGEAVISAGHADQKLHLVLSGDIDIQVGTPPRCVGTLAAGQLIGENVLLGAPPGHSATAVARSPVETACFQQPDFEALVRQRPDIGVAVYRNLAAGISDKLKSVDEQLREGGG